MPHDALEIKLHFWIFAHVRSSIKNEALEIIHELNNSFLTSGLDETYFPKFFVLSMYVISFVVDVELD